MKSFSLFVALAAMVAGAALQPNLVERAPVPITTPTPGCTPGAYIQDPDFTGNGSDWAVTTPSGNLKVKTSFGGNDGLKSDTSGKGAFNFQVKSGSGNFTIYQEVCLKVNTAYDITYNVGLSAPGKNSQPQNTGCTSVVILNGQMLGSASAICFTGAEAPTNYGRCTEASYDKNTFYWQQGTFFQSPQAVNQIGIEFNCAYNATSGGNSAGHLDLVTVEPINTGGFGRE